ncbi:unnamed protein product [Allacma fusca]|uniref:Tubulin/FtsZ GTPase domain-containing protein n=1 Tax=Allacma fusca TaxID=39272 RepID=A0A8J2KT12_9HEXA|nr:unnamed protein product [Allacma fusca]
MASSQSLIFIHVGQGGVQFGSAFWELLSLEHGLTKDGKFQRRNVFSEPSGPLASSNLKLNTFFMEGPQGRQVPRALFLDLDPTSIEGVRNKNQIFNSNQLMSWKEDASSNYARGYYSQNVEATMSRIQDLAEASDKLEGFVLCRSLGGGTGSGFGSLILKNLAEAYPKLTKVTVDIVPSTSFSTTATEAYNTVLATHSSIENADVTFLFENEALLDQCRQNLGLKEPKINNLNNLMAQIMSAVTSCIHIDGNINRSLGEIKSNLVPYSRLHFPILSFAPILPPENTQTWRNFDTLLMEVLNDGNQVVKTDPLTSERNMAINFMYRGQMTLADANSIDAALVENSKMYSNKLKFVDWVPKDLKAGVCPGRSTPLPKGEIYTRTNALLLMKNTTAVSASFTKMLHRFGPLYARKSFVHWYLQEGMEESEFSEAKNDLIGLIREYHECAKGTNVSRPSSKILSEFKVKH